MLSHAFKTTLPQPPTPTSQDIGTEYRQLVSRAVTQRLHSPTLGSSSINTWELDERKIAKAKARERLWNLGVTWDQFVLDVKSAELEVHVLTPTRYEVPNFVNQRAVQENQRMRYVGSGRTIDGRGVREAQYKQMQALRMFNVKRLEAIGTSS